MTRKPLHIAFDAKRAFFNRSGLGNYSRDLIRIISSLVQDNRYYLFKYKQKSPIDFNIEVNTSVVLPKSRFYQIFGSLWRLYGVSKIVRKSSIDIYHGLSHDLPLGIKNCGVKTVVTVHDCIYKRYPEYYGIISPLIFSLKQRYALSVADRIIAISEQTKEDIIHYFNVDESKIDVVYQGCNAQFYTTVCSTQRVNVKAKYKLPDKYILYVGTIEERKNLLFIFESLVQGKIDYPVVVVGQPTKYIKQVKDYIKLHNLNCIFLHDADFIDFPSIYQIATCFVYPSIFEGFGIPILEALNSGIPVITTAGGVFPEVGGDAALYVESGNTNAMASTLISVISNKDLRMELADKGRHQALKFRDEVIAAKLMSVYDKLS